MATKRTTTKKTETVPKTSTSSRTRAKAKPEVEIVEITEEPKPVVKKAEPKIEPKKRVFGQHDLILCKNISAGWLKMVGKSGIPYVWNATGDLCEVEYGDLWAKKTAKSQYLYEPYIIIEDDELLEEPRWKDLKDFYNEKVYGYENVDAVLNTPVNSIHKVLERLSNGMKRAVAVKAAVMVENGSLDSIKKIKIIDEVCNTDLMSILPD